jgi:hypothetical protein
MTGKTLKPEVCSGVRFCAFEDCRLEFRVSGNSNRQKFCSPSCGRRQRYLPKKLATQSRRNSRYRIRTRDFSLSFDGRHGGNLNANYTTQESMQ